MSVLGYIFTEYNMVARAIQGFIAAWGQGHIAWGPLLNNNKIPIKNVLLAISTHKSNSSNTFFRQFFFYWPLAGHKPLYGPLVYLAGLIGSYGPLKEHSDWTISVWGIIILHTACTVHTDDCSVQGVAYPLIFLLEHSCEMQNRQNGRKFKMKQKLQENWQQIFKKWWVIEP